ncbi:MAG: FtsQ-type POTRA domain-containing protein [Treponema sp.]|nr:FtsQ-type POTRA domain-containing protein [Treponema sp.]
MSDVGIFFSDEDYFDEEENSKAEAKSQRRYKIVIAAFFVFCILLLGEFIVYRFIKPSLSSPKVTVSGYKTLSPEDIAMKLLPLNTRNWFTFDAEAALSILSSEPCLANVSVEKKFPDRIMVDVVERTPVAMTFVVEKGKSVPFEIDENGVLFSNKQYSPNGKQDFPIISGIPVENMTGGMRIPEKYKPLIEQIANIPKEYFIAISEICVLPKESGSYELALIPSTGHVKVLCDRALNEDALKYMMLALEVVKKLESEAKVVDLRYGSVSYM